MVIRSLLVPQLQPTSSSFQQLIPRPEIRATVFHPTPWNILLAPVTGNFEPDAVEQYPNL